MLIEEDVILVKHTASWGLSLRVVKKLARKTLRERFDGGRAQLSLLFVGKNTAKKLNIDYRKMTYVPQVLGFPMEKKTGADGLVHLGDIVICVPLLKKEAILQNKRLVQVLEEWLLHGVENLLID